VGLALEPVENIENVLLKLPWSFLVSWARKLFSNHYSQSTDTSKIRFNTLPRKIPHEYNKYLF